MNERFKFRAWDSIRKKMVTENDVIGEGDSNNFMPAIAFIGEFWAFDLESSCNGGDPEGIYKIMQCTGLKDKNGKLIYEGDILSLYGFNKKQNEEMERSVVKWDYQEASYYFGSVTSYNEDNSSFSNIEIIGNIYENPELKENE